MSIGSVLQAAAQDFLRRGYPEGAIWQDFEEGPESQAGVRSLLMTKRPGLSVCFVLIGIKEHNKRCN
jgi:hypothetical protein